MTDTPQVKSFRSMDELTTYLSSMKIRHPHIHLLFNFLLFSDGFGILKLVTN